MTLHDGKCDSCGELSGILCPLAILDELPTGGMGMKEVWYCFTCLNTILEENEENNVDKDEDEDTDDDDKDDPREEPEMPELPLYPKNRIVDNMHREARLDYLVKSGIITPEEKKSLVRAGYTKKVTDEDIKNFTKNHRDILFDIK